MGGGAPQGMKIARRCSLIFQNRTGRFWKIALLFTKEALEVDGALRPLAHPHWFTQTAGNGRALAKRGTTRYTPIAITLGKKFGVARFIGTIGGSG
ncbi:MAG: hypothetical protein Fur0021_34600 [Candidatus Promineifilaceae bacterium]